MIDGFERIRLCFYVLVIPSGFLKNNFLLIQQHFLSTHSGTGTYSGKPVMKAQETALAPNQFKCHLPRWSASEPFRSCFPPSFLTFSGLRAQTTNLSCFDLSSGLYPELARTWDKSSAPGIWVCLQLAITARTQNFYERVISRFTLNLHLIGLGIFFILIVRKGSGHSPKRLSFLNKTFSNSVLNELHSIKVTSKCINGRRECQTAVWKHCAKAFTLKSKIRWFLLQSAYKNPERMNTLPRSLKADKVSLNYFLLSFFL